MTLDDYLDAARQRIDRVELADLDNALTTGAILVDIRPEESRVENGEMPGAHVIDRNVLLWRLSPSSDT